MSQSRAASFTESCLNTASGFILSLVAGHFVFPAFGLAVTFLENVAMTAIFTVISVARAYVWRRIFNARLA